MNLWMIVLGALYFCVLIIAAIRARRSTKTDSDFITAGSSIGAIFGCLTVAATLFSTFTLMGMPDLFRTHGVGAWIFLGVADCALALVALWFGVHLRRRIVARNFDGFSSWLGEQYQCRSASYTYLLGIFLFLVPYVAIQIKGISLFLFSLMPTVFPTWVWSVTIISFILIYSETGGLKAIIFADSIQGLMLFVATMIVATTCLSYFGGVVPMFDSIASSNNELLSTPGPSQLFTYQFLISSFLAIVMIPVTQPQMTIRLVIMKDNRALARMVILLGIFSFLLILATLPIGFYGAARYPDHSVGDFVAQVLVYDQAPIVAAVVVVGLVAAAISTADSQLFALGSEFQSGIKINQCRATTAVRYAIIVFAIAALIVSLVSNAHIVLLARTSFAGTSLLAPMILSAVFFPNRLSQWIPYSTAAGLILFLASIMGLIGDDIGGIRTDVILLISVTLSTLVTLRRNK